MSAQDRSSLSRLLSSARAQPPVRYDVERGLARHRALQLSATALPEWAASVPRSAGAARAWRGWVAKLGLGALLVGGGLGLWQVRTSPSPVKPPRVVSAPASAAPPPAAATPASPERASSPQVSGGASVRQARSSDESASPGRASPALRPAPPGVPRPRAVAAAREPRAPSPSAAVSGSVRAAPEVQRFEVRPFERDDAAPDAEELRWLARAEAALRDDPARALSLLRAGDARFAGGYFGEEREYLTVIATRALGQRETARALARKFLASHPRSPYAERVRASTTH